MIIDRGATVTAGREIVSRLIGDLQSSIGFSPKTINLKEPPTGLTCLQSPSKPDGRHHMLRTVSSGAVSAPNSDSTSPTSGTSEAYSTDETSDGSAVFLGHAFPNMGLDVQDVSASPRKPKMLLVEVRHLCC